MRRRWTLCWSPNYLKWKLKPLELMIMSQNAVADEIEIPVTQPLLSLVLSPVHGLLRRCVRGASVTHQPPSVTHQPPSVTHQPPSVTHQPPSVTHQPPSVTHLSYAVSVLFPKYGGQFRYPGLRTPQRFFPCLNELRLLILLLHLPGTFSETKGVSRRLEELSGIRFRTVYIHILSRAAFDSPIRCAHNSVTHCT